MDKDKLKSKIIGLGEHSTRKSYYPELRKKIDELELYKKVFDHIDDGVMIFNARNSELVYFNRALQIIFPDIDIHKPLKSVIHDQVLVNQIERQQIPDKTMLSINSSGTQAQTFEISFTDVKDFSAEYYVGIFRNITQYISLNNELKEKNDEIQAQNEEYLTLNEELHERNTEIYELYEKLLVSKEKAEESDRLKTAFLQNMSHEVRTPLNAVIGFSELLKYNGVDDDEQTAYIDTIMKSGTQLQAIIDNIIHISTIDAGQEKLNPSSIHLPKFLDTLYQIHTPNFENNHLDFSFCKNQDLQDIHIQTDETKLFQIISNLLNNAQKFTPQGVVKLHCYPSGRDIIFKVEDNGIGIEAHNLNQIFDRFYKIREQHNLNVEGTGLGLSITKAYIEMLKGTISVSSVSGKGTTFSISIPIDLFSEF
ncbi:MAG: HAMP domain-containing histidine kinase [Marinilabiliaceae bacterium]|nr:HAMP domain-containing histidine kinase [Marinilabiliaceae bacterium]